MDDDEEETDNKEEIGAGGGAPEGARDNPRRREVECHNLTHIPFRSWV